MQQQVRSKPVNYETEEYMTRVYGKAAYQNLRSHKPAPYLHYQTVIKPRHPRPAAKVPSPESKLKAHRDHYYFSAPNTGTNIGCRL